MIASRALAATLGGYGLASLAAAACAVALPPALSLARPDAVLAGMMAGLLVQAAAALWAFAAGSARRAWLGLAAPGAVLGVLVALGRAGAAP